MSRGREIAERLRDRGLRLTPQRAVILEIVAEKEGHRHLTAQEVYVDARDRLPGLNAATVYRTLEALHQAGLVDMMVTGSSVVRFSLHDPEHRHCHLSCRNCTSELEVSYDVVRELKQKLERDHGFVLDADHLTMTGLCKDCSPR
ncbi:MAG: Fur family transcriptional regulator [Candidatus Xenobia bacterium]